MPCDTIRLQSIAFSPEKADLLKKTAERLGWTVNHDCSVILTDTGERITLANGQASARNLSTVTKLKVEYANTVTAQAVAWAQQKGWQTQKVGNKVNMRKL